MLDLLNIMKAFENMIEYLGSWDFWWYVFWLSVAVGLGCSVGHGINKLLTSVLESVAKNLTNLRFKKGE